MSFAAEIARDLARDLNAVAKMAENPLVVIGFSATILELGLTEEELWEACRAFARGLTAHFDETRAAGKSESGAELQRRYAEALNGLRSRERFLIYLKEFRDQTAEYRSALNVEVRVNAAIRSEIRRLQNEVEETRKKLLGGSRENSAEAMQRLATLCLLADRVQVRDERRPREAVRHFEACSIGACEELLLLRFTIESRDLLSPRRDERSLQADEKSLNEVIPSTEVINRIGFGTMAFGEGEPPRPTLEEKEIERFSNSPTVRLAYRGGLLTLKNFLARQGVKGIGRFSAWLDTASVEESGVILLRDLPHEMTKGRYKVVGVVDPAKFSRRKLTSTTNTIGFAVDDGALTEMQNMIILDHFLVVADVGKTQTLTLSRFLRREGEIGREHYSQTLKDDYVKKRQRGEKRRRNLFMGSLVMAIR